MTVSVTLAAAALPLILSMSLNQGHFIYTLDDPYIHLALADNISQGHYGINQGENTAPSSSVIWPFLLVPFAVFSFFTIVPLILNILFAAGTAVVLAGFFKWENLPFTLAALFCFNLAGLVLTGMEHSLQLFLIVCAASGVSDFAVKGKLPRWLLPVLVLAPAVRYECLSVSLTALLFLFLAGVRKQSVTALLICLSLLGGFSLFLLQQGLDPFPSSVFAKSSVVSGAGSVASVAGNLIASLGSFRGLAQAFLLVPLFLFGFAQGRDKKLRFLAFSTAAAVLLHLAAGRFGWFHRYGVYIWAYSVMICFTLYRKRIEQHRSLTLLLLLALSGNYLSGYTNIALASSNIYRQQFQMRRFVHHWLGEPVAVNDLGLVCLGYDHYVLDLWGLAVPEALQGSENPLWVDSSAQASGVNCAIVYRDELPGIQHWTPVARMELAPPLVVCVSGGVDFLSAPWASADSLELMVRDFAFTLPGGIDLYWYR